VSALVAEVTDEVIDAIERQTARGIIQVPRLHTPCWLFTGGLTNSGHGMVYRRLGNGRVVTWPAHLAMFRRYRCDDEELPKHSEICHECDVASCVNPDHMDLADHPHNMWQRGVRGSARDQGVLAMAMTAQLALRRQRKVAIGSYVSAFHSRKRAL
jgi:hypothetical protein